MDKEKIAIERLKAASEMSLAYYKQPLSLPSDVREGMQMIAAQNRALLEDKNASRTD